MSLEESKEPVGEVMFEFFFEFVHNPLIEFSFSLVKLFSGRVLSFGPEELVFERVEALVCIFAIFLIAVCPKRLVKFIFEYHCGNHFHISFSLDLKLRDDLSSFDFHF